MRIEKCAVGYMNFASRSYSRLVLVGGVAIVRTDVLMLVICKG